MTLYSMNHTTGKLVSAKDMGIDVQPNTLYYHGSYVMPSIVYVTRILEDNVCYVYVIDRWRFDMTGYEHYASIDSFKLSVHSGTTNVLRQIEEAPTHDFYKLEASKVWSNNVSEFDIPQNYTTYEEKHKQGQIEAKVRREREAKIIRYDTVEVAKIVRRKLKEKFPGTKFSVRSNRYSMGSSIDVNWTDGPTEKQVKEIVGNYYGSTFDGMQDLKEYHTSIDPDTGNEVRWGNDSIRFNRNYSPNTLNLVWESLVHMFSDKLSFSDLEIKESGYWNLKNPYAEVLGSGHYDSAYYVFSKRLSEYSCETTQQEIKEETQPEESDSGVQFGEYKGHATITLPYGSKGFSFGVNKAKAILEYIADIEKFVKENS